MADAPRPDAPPPGDESSSADATDERDTARDVQQAEEPRGPHHGAPEAPVLIEPKEEALVDGTDVTLRWEPIAGAEDYLVEVAADAPFHEVVVQEETTDTSLTLDPLPTDGDLYYWRVVTKRGDEWSHGDRIESFVSVTAEQVRDADGDGEAPDRRESYGPAVALFSSAGAEAAAEATGDEERLAREREMGVAHEGVEAGQIIGFAGVVVAAIVLIVCVLFFWITSVAQTTREATVDTSVYPELRETETRAAQQLDQYELVSERDSTYRVPIGEAMRIVADEAYDQTAGRRYSGELRRDLPATASGDNRGGGNGPEPSAPEGPAGP